MKGVDDDLVGFGAVAFVGGLSVAVRLFGAVAILLLSFAGAEALIFFVGDGVFYGFWVLGSAESGVGGAERLFKALRVFHLFCSHLEQSVTGAQEKDSCTEV